MPENASLFIAELFTSRQGEGELAGTPSFFVRTSGCNLRCWFCDTPYASWRPEGKSYTIQAILAEAARSRTSHAVVTGGEPMIQSGVEELCRGLRELGMHVTIETAGTVARDLCCDLMSVSPKLASSSPGAQHPRWSVLHERRRHCPEIIRALVTSHPYQIKFVIDSVADCREVEAYLEEFPEISRDRVWLMPQGISRDELEQRALWLEPYCAVHGMRFCPRLHIEWYGNTRGT